MIRRHSACPDSIIVYFELIRLLLYPAKEISFNSEYPEYVGGAVKNLELYQCLNLPLADMIVFGVFWNSREARTHASKKAVIQLDIKAVALRTLRYSCQFGCRSKFWIKLVGASFKVCILPERKNGKIRQETIS